MSNTDNPFTAPKRQLKIELAGLLTVLLVAGGIAALDMRGAAKASTGFSAEQAISVAQDHGLSPSGLSQETPSYSDAHGTEVWHVEGETDAVVDARTGELLEVSF